MAPDESKPTSKDEPSQPGTPSYEEWWAEQQKPSRLRNLTPEQRRVRAEGLRLARRARWDKSIRILTSRQAG